MIGRTDQSCRLFQVLLLTVFSCTLGSSIWAEAADPGCDCVDRNATQSIIRDWAKANNLAVPHSVSAEISTKLAKDECRVLASSIAESCEDLQDVRRDVVVNYLDAARARGESATLAALIHEQLNGKQGLAFPDPNHFGELSVALKPPCNEARVTIDGERMGRSARVFFVGAGRVEVEVHVEGVSKCSGSVEVQRGDSATYECNNACGSSEELSAR